ncbi:radical SAM protein [Polyangium mundeleinium]|uniref:Radical SAM protein n=1 Tax=Polyangium mundeleinium TaxID=2995306 RepID=A0ABT5EP22_9BACT|nr:radical SAM protein [Polyangium mundeleinium]MDC0742938.1 radical SAM protein [Polyangium mundeleinium]
MPFTNFVWKIASRCNLDCTYCYVYHAGDSSWRRQPPYMGEDVARAAARRIREYCEHHQLTRININFHGGEPLLCGRERLEGILRALRETFDGSGVRVNSSLQSNGIPFTRELGELLLRADVGLYISLDGPPRINDLRRVDHRMRPTSADVEDKLALITSPELRPIFQGFLAVVDPRSSAREVFDYLASFSPPAIDFLLPLRNHDSRVEDDGRPDPYAAWLIECFDHWLGKGSRVRIRSFERWMTWLLRPEAGDALDHFDSIVIESNGEMEADDTLKTAYHGAAHLGHNVFAHSLVELERAPALHALRVATRPSATCLGCGYYSACRGGHVSHRYSSSRGFDNPSVYCPDLQVFIRHVHARLVAELRGIKRAAPPEDAPGG